MAAFALRICPGALSSPGRICAGVSRTCNREPGFPNKVLFRMAAIEVEKKFEVTSSTMDKLLTLSPSAKVVTFEDCYYDEQLAERNIWLRQRNGTWELKVPLPGDASQRKEATVYREYCGSQVWAELNREELKETELNPFAKILTERTLLQVVKDSQPVKIVVDICSAENGFRYDVGEVEIVVKEQAEVKDAKARINAIFKELELKEEPNVGGKLLVYLREKNRSLLQRLIAQGAL